MAPASVENNLLKRLLVRTKPVPFPIWMSSLSFVTVPFVLLAWAAHPTAPFKAILFIQLYMASVGFLMGLFVPKQFKLPWFASVGEVLEVSRKLAKPDPKARFASNLGFGFALSTLMIFAWFTLKFI